MTKPVKILIAEDNEDDVIMIRKAFEDAPLLQILAVVDDGDTALDYLRRAVPGTGPDLVILDVSMPRKDGLTTLREIKADPALRRLPVVMLTTSQRPEDVARSYGDGASTYITKPIGITALRDLVGRFEQYWAKVAILPDPK